jgi:hypothetical protein
MLKPARFLASCVVPMEPHPNENEVHAVRIRGDGGLEHRRYTGTWTDGGAIGKEAAIAKGGVVLVPDVEGGLVLHVLAFGSGAIRRASLPAGGSSWSAWSTAVAATSDKRSALTGWSSGPRGPAALAWTEPRNAGAVVVGVKLR